MFKLFTIHYSLFTIIWLACSKPAVEAPPVVPVTGLKDLTSQVLIGSPIDVANNKSAKYATTIQSELNAGQSLWYARWGGWIGNNSYNFSSLNTNINWMKENGLSPSVHMLVGPDTYMPDWFINGNWSPTTLDSLLRNLIFSIMDVNDNKNKVDVWNVVNELFDDEGSYRTNMVWNQLGWEADSSGLSGKDNINDSHPIFIRKAFNYCREKTNKKLELRDYNIENNVPMYQNDKRHKAIYQLLKHALNTNIPIDAVGIQGHLSVGNISWLTNNNALQHAVARFKALGIEVYITELDAGIGNQAWSTELAQQQKADYTNYISQAIAGGAARIYTWGIQDGLDRGWLTNEHPLPWDENLNRKPAYYGIQDALK